MASADLTQELKCSVCLNIYIDPVTLRCGHNYCWVCIDRVLDTQEESGVYSCPECRAVFQDRPVLEKNRKLCNIADCVRFINPEEETKIFCTYCVHSPVPALKTCLRCEASLCHIHCRTHNKSAEHVLVDPTTSMEMGKCFIHKEILRYFCTKDAVCICVSCYLIGEHRGHQMESMDEAYVKKKNKLRNVLQNLTTKRDETEKRIQDLQDRSIQNEQKAAGITESVAILFRDIRRQLRVLENRVLTMASADLRQELDCSICLNIYTDPVTLRCGHKYFQVYLNCVQDTEEGSGVYTCPECRAEFQDHPVLEKSRKLCNIAEHVRSIPEEETEIFCTYCVHSPVPALKTCLRCEASLCDIHCKTHNKSAEHVLIDSTTSLDIMKCSIHEEILKYYCTKDAACICVSCCQIGEHRGHQMESLDEASEKKKEKLRNVLQKLTTKREEAEKRVQSLQERRRDNQEKAAGVTERVTALFRDIRRQLEYLEKRVLSEISRQEENISVSVSDLIQQLEIKKDELSRKIRHIEELCNMSDPVIVLHEPDTGDLCDTEDRERHDDQVHGVGDLDAGLISEKLRKELSDIITGINVWVCVQEPTDILLDIDTAGDNIHISSDLKAASWSDITQNHPETPERFQCNQVLSTRSFSSGRHYWEVEVREPGWMIGMCYPSIDRRGRESIIGCNDKSWGLYRCENEYSMLHNNEEVLVSDNIAYDRVRIYLDYEAGQLSFYSLCDPIRHLHTFTATFTEPLHAALCVDEGCINISGRVGSREK
ncbi:E3 ubiquitin-protein ligase TRIM11-like [Mixophyes fleayi]|uniref:E3 ubiquitin-protein ligase TRIM11-like n=1 Tax=Mixophyes fleayi TaxID=3061075 RepID=UPI003F4D9317